MTTKVALSLLAVVIFAADAAVIRRQKRSLAKGAAFLPLLGGYAIYRKLKTGSFAPPRASVGVKGDVGLGPLSIGGKVGIGGGGFPNANEEVWYEPITVDNSGVSAKGFHANGQGGLGFGASNFHAGAGAGVGLKEGASFPKLRIPSIPKFRLPSFGVNGGIGVGSGSIGVNGGFGVGSGHDAENTWTEPIDADIDEEGWVTIDESAAQASQSGGLFGVQGGLGLGPFKVNAGFEAGR